MAALPLRIWVHVQRLGGAISRDVAHNRLGHATQAKPPQSVIWIHAASLGELSAVRPFLRHLATAKPDHRLLITTNNPNALDVAKHWDDVPAILQTAPLDIPSILKRFLNHWQPVAFANIETEVWPNRFAALGARGIPCIGLNARMSATSAKRFAKLGTSTGLHHFTAIFAQNEQSAERFRTLLDPSKFVTTLPNFKSLVSLPSTDPALVSQFDRAKTILAASTHEGEDEPLIAAFTELAKTDPSLKLIIAPRHPHRAPDITALAKSAGHNPKPLGDPVDTSITIAHTLGQLPELYALAAVTFVGGSIVPDIGGHTPYEPIRANSAIVTGTMTDNFTAEYTALSAANACQLTTHQTLASDLRTALTTAETLAQNARATFPPIENPTALFDQIITAMERPS